VSTSSASSATALVAQGPAGITTPAEHMRPTLGVHFAGPIDLLGTTALLLLALAMLVPSIWLVFRALVIEFAQRGADQWS